MISKGIVLDGNPHIADLKRFDLALTDQAHLGIKACDPSCVKKATARRRRP
jgi:hypothetical protein